jgi:hypothetical protein
MANPWHHAVSSAKKWGGEPDDYLPIHQWFDETKAHHPDFRHRALRHHSEGIFLMESIFGPTVRVSTGRLVPTRWVGEQHVREDLGFIPTASHWLKHLVAGEGWMYRGAREKLDHLSMDDAPSSQAEAKPAGAEACTRAPA